MLLHTLHRNYLAWYIIPCFALMLLGVVCHPHLALLLLVVVCHLLPCIAITCCGALLVPYAIIVACYGLSSFALHYYFCGFSPFALC
jgi:hypothetical protein